MDSARIARSWPVAVVLLAAISACSSSTGGFRSALRESALGAPAPRSQPRDSAMAQRVADIVGPRVEITARFSNNAGSRRVEANFRLYDDAFVVVGHLGADGRMRVVFPTSPGDDGFLQGGKNYYVPSFFAGFEDEFRYQYTTFAGRAQSYQSQVDSYDGGLGYVFVIASWRPMRLDRVADGDRWQVYEIENIAYMVDPREAVEELGAVIAGDNREAYTIEYAKYLTTNNGAFSLASLNSYNSACYGYGYSPFSAFGFGGGSWLFSPYGYSPYSRYGYGSGCGGYAYGYGYGYGYGYTFAPFIPKPRSFGITRPTPPEKPVAPVVPVATRPRVPVGSPHGDAPTPGGIGPRVEPQVGIAGASQPVNGNLRLRQRGLIADDAGGGASPVSGSGQLGIAGRRPSIQEMVGRRRIDDGGERGASGMGITRAAPSGQPGSSNAGRAREGTAYQGGMSRPRFDPGSGAAHTGGGAGGSGYRGRDAGAGSGATRSTPRTETPRPRPAPPPAKPSSPPPSSSSKEVKKS